MYSRGFKVRLPSQLYLNKTEGLCGNCNSEIDDDSMSNQAGLGWLVSKLLREPPTGEEDLCQIAPQPECTPLNPDQDPCLKLLDSDLFKVKIYIVGFIFCFQTLWLNSLYSIPDVQCCG